MTNQISIQAGPVQMQATLNDTSVANMIWDTLPIEASANPWGDEIYFGIPVDAELENGQEVVELGDLAYWPSGHAFCIFFGRTPASRGDEIRPASSVTVVGQIQGDPARFKEATSGVRIVISKSNSES